LDKWYETTIGEQATLQRGFDITRKQMSPGSIPVYSSGGLNGYHNQAQVAGPGVVMGRKGTLGTVFYVAEDFWPHDTTLWVRDFHGNLPRFVYYFFKGMAPRLLALDVGSANPTLNRNHVHPIPITWPGRRIQERIARILGTLDDKIELNRRMNRTLEAIARAIFKSWFIDFDPVIDNAILNGKPIPDEFTERAAVRREILARSQPSPPAPLPEVEGRNYRGGFDFSGFVETARELRKKQTSAEEILWGILRDRQFLGLKFRRQHQIGDYIADFYCHEHKLVVELDGGIHRTQESKDAKRDAYMQSLDLAVLRIANADVLENPDDVLSRITEVVQSSPSPAGRGGGEAIEDLSPSTSGRGARGEGVAGYRHLFPDSFQDSPLGMIPRGWEVKTMESLSDRIAMGPFGSNIRTDCFVDDGVPVVRGKNLTDGFVDNDFVFVSEEKASALKRSAAMPADIVITHRGTLGQVGIVPDRPRYSRYIVSQSQMVLSVDRKAASPRFLYEYLRSPTGQHELLANRSQTGVPAIARPATSLKAIRLPVPPRDLQAAFDSCLKPCAERVVANCIETRALVTIRDALLPRLLSGELIEEVAE